MNIFEMILGIFAGDTKVIDDIRNCRINPDYGNITRNDLEFFIPQLCSYIIDESKPHELRECLVVVLLEASNSFFYFSHRLYFFLHSYLVDPGLSEYGREMYLNQHEVFIECQPL